MYGAKESLESIGIETTPSPIELEDEHAGEGLSPRELEERAAMEWLEKRGAMDLLDEND